MVTLNALPAASFDFSDFENTTNLFRFWLFTSFLFAFGAVFGSGVIFFGMYVMRADSAPVPLPGHTPATWYWVNQYMMIVGIICITSKHNDIYKVVIQCNFSNMMMRFAITHDSF